MPGRDLRRAVRHGWYCRLLPRSVGKRRNKGGTRTNPLNVAARLSARELALALRYPMNV